MTKLLKKSYPTFDCDAHINDPVAIYDYMSEKDRELMVANGYWADRDYRGLAFLNGRSVASNAHSRSIIIGSCHSGPEMTPELTHALKMMDLSDEQLDYIENRGGYDPYGRLKEMDQEGIDQVLIIPTMLNSEVPFMENIYAARAYARAYNDWVADYCKAAPERLYPMAILPVHFPPFAADEVYRIAEKGFKVAGVRPIDANGGYPSAPGLDPVWRALEDTGVVLGMHPFPALRQGGNEFTKTMYSPGELSDIAERSTGRMQGAQSQDLGFIWESMVWLNAVFLSGFLDRYPRFKMAIFESNCLWLPFVLDECDRAVKLYANERPTPLKRLPSEACREQVRIGFEGDEDAVFSMWDIFQDIGIWASDAYHHDAADAWTAVEQIERHNVPEAAAAKLMGGNALEFYGIEPKLFVTEQARLDRPDWWPSAADIEAAQAPEAAVARMRAVMASGGVAGPGGAGVRTLHEDPQQYQPWHLKKPLDQKPE